MARVVIQFLLIFAALFGGGARAADSGWARLKLGMTATQTVAAIGQPLLRTTGKGFEIWIYDQRAEVVFYGGPLVAWTSPATAQTPARAVDIWQAGAGSADGPMFVLPPAPQKLYLPRWDVWTRDQPAPFWRYERRR